MYVAEYLQELDLDDQPLNVLIDKLNDLYNKYPNHINLRIKSEYYYDDSSFNVWGDREETEKERFKREQAAARAYEIRRRKKIKDEAAEKALYERLKKKYS